jgi:hypothetical protein
VGEEAEAILEWERHRFVPPACTASCAKQAPFRRFYSTAEEDAHAAAADAVGAYWPELFPVARKRAS